MLDEQGRIVVGIGAIAAALSASPLHDFVRLD
jgi:hypothetical protein